MQIKWDIVLKFFFTSHLLGYVGRAPKTDVVGKPGFRQIVIIEGPLRFVDEYMKVLGSAIYSHSFGTTTIWYEGVPIWGMSYHGFYKREALPLLRGALQHAYESRNFVGGRGPASFSKDGQRYSNQVIESDFERFTGSESIVTIEEYPVWLGSHYYSGRALVRTR